MGGISSLDGKEEKYEVSRSSPEGLEGVRTVLVRKVLYGRTERVTKGVEIGIRDDDIILRFVAPLCLR